MGVLSCDRACCNNVMCDFIIDYGQTDYICRECLDELTSLKDIWEADITYDVMKERIREFMGSRSRDNTINERDRERIDEMFNDMITDRHSY
jgi:hypothetical protein